MRILAVETSGRLGSLAAMIGETAAARTMREIQLGGGQRTAQALAPALQSLLAEVGWPAESIELVAVAVGPGSFTGLRIGVTTAKVLAYAVGAQLVGVDTLAVLAAQAPAEARPLWAIMDAQRNELFVAKFPDPGSTTIMAEEKWLSELRTGDHVTGPALKRMHLRLPIGVEVLAETNWHPMATAVGQVAWRAYQSGARVDVWALVPKYYRASAAEEKKTGRQGD